MKYPTIEFKPFESIEKTGIYSEQGFRCGQYLFEIRCIGNQKYRCRLTWLLASNENNLVIQIPLKEKILLTIELAKQQLNDWKYELYQEAGK